MVEICTCAAMENEEDVTTVAASTSRAGTRIPHPPAAAPVEEIAQYLLVPCNAHGQAKKDKGRSRRSLQSGFCCLCRGNTAIPRESTGS